jgi:hypothetical protein
VQRRQCTLSGFQSKYTEKDIRLLAAMDVRIMLTEHYNFMYQLIYEWR